MFKGETFDLLYSPSDLTRFVDSPFASWATRYNLENPSLAYPKDEDTEEMKLLQDRGLAHEAEFLRQLEASDQSVCVIEPEGRQPDDLAAETLVAMKQGHDVIFQAYLRAGVFQGYADFLFKVPGRSELGEHHYEPWDTKLALSVKPYFMIQLCCYAELLETIQGRRPSNVGVILGDQQREQHRTTDFFFAYNAIKEAFLEQMAGDFSAEAASPVPEAGAEHRPFNDFVDEHLIQIDHLSQVAGITRRQIDRLAAVGISTMTELADCKAAKIPGLQDELLERLKEQAKLQRDSKGRDRPLYRVVVPDEARRAHGLARLPQPSPLDVFFDMEGYPLAPGGLEYLFGATTRGSEGLAFRAFWAHDKVMEKRAFEDFIDWVTERWRTDPTMHIYHYAPYEVTAMRKLMGEHATREDAVDDLLRNDVFVDLYQVVREGLRVGEPSYSIKNLEHLYWEARDGEVQSGGASIVQYYNWTQSGESDDIDESPLLKAIHDYNRDDCDSTLALYDWLLERSVETGIVPVEAVAEPDEAEAPELPEDVVARRELRAEILAGLPENVTQDGSPDERLCYLLAELLEFHRREDKPAWWRRFDRLGRPAEELVDDSDCLARITRTTDPSVLLGRGSVACWYDYPSQQETKIRPGSPVLLHAAPDIGGSITVDEMDRSTARLRLKFTKGALSDLSDQVPPSAATLIPKESSRAGKLKTALMEVISTWHETGELPPALGQFLRRQPPSLTPGQQYQQEAGETASARAVRLTTQLNTATLCVQGPPGAGKTYTGARMILSALKTGKRVGVTSNSHKAIQNLMGACRDAAEKAGVGLRAAKVDPNPKSAFFETHPEIRPAEAKDVAGLLDGGVGLIGATAWTFARPELADAFDILFIDEAGQVSLANLVAIARSSANIVLLGDQRQLAQPIQGSHPGDTGLSVLDYLLQDHATIPDELGIFLDQTWRMHPDICDFISDAFYEDRLGSVEKTRGRSVVVSGATRSSITTGTGIQYLPVNHHGNTVGSQEEVERVTQLVQDLQQCGFTEDAGATHRPLRLEDILIVAPYNVQVSRLKEALPSGARVGTVDKFQGQEAPVVILSMASSDVRDSPRGAAFLFDPNRLNVALSRAQALALVVANPGLAAPGCTSLEQLRLGNLFCRVVREGM